MAKALQDGRLVDLPLSTPFLKLLCQGDVACPVQPLVSDSHRRSNKAYSRAGSHPPAQQHHAPAPPSNTEDDPMTSSVISQDGDGLSSSSSKPGSPRDPSQPWFADYLSHEDLAVVDPTRGRFLLQLRALATRRRQILTDPTLSHEDRCRQADNLALTQPNLSSTAVATSPYSSGKPSIVSQKIQSAAGQVRLEDLGLTFQFAPSSRVFGFTDVELRPGGADFEVRLPTIFSPF